jgi:predicted acyltransferase/uncharacterized membrane protein YjdF
VNLISPARKIPGDVWLLLAMAAGATAWSLRGPTDWSTWLFEIVPGGVSVIVLAATVPRFRFSAFFYAVVTLHFVILAAGAKYTYAEVPLGNWFQDAFHLSRNYFDRVGHLFQGLTVALLTREILIRRTPLGHSRLVAFLSVCVGLAFSAFYELLEWQWVVWFYPDQGPQWLGMQGDMWDAQGDMFMALCGAVLAVTALARPQDRSIGQIGATDSSIPAHLSATTTPAGLRLLSLDAMRGFAMFWLVGGREFTLGMVTWLYPSVAEALEDQLTHPKWQGFVAWDLVMPVFLFLVGTSMPFSLAKRCELGLPLGSTYWRVARRVVMLWILGWVAQKFKYQAEGMELYSNALQAIAVGYLVTSLALLHLRKKGQLILFCALVLIYGAMLMFVPFAGHPAGTMERTANLPRYVEEVVLGDYRHEHSFTWVLSSFGFAATVLLGAMSGHILRAPFLPGKKLLWLVTVGVACMTAGWLWSYWIPLNRHLWTSSMVLWAGGISFLALALFYAVIDVAGFSRWSFPLAVIGANALLAYILDPLFDKGSNWLVTTLIPGCPEVYLDLLSSICELGLLWLLLWYLYHKRWFFRA